MGQALDVHRIHFAFTITFHYIFPQLMMAFRSAHFCTTFSLWLRESPGWSILSEGGQVYITRPSNCQSEVQREQPMSLEVVIKYCTI